MTPPHPSSQKSVSIDHGSNNKPSQTSSIYVFPLVSLLTGDRCSELLVFLWFMNLLTNKRPKTFTEVKCISCSEVKAAQNFIL